jgi:hypothetical protein
MLASFGNTDSLVGKLGKATKAIRPDSVLLSQKKGLAVIKHNCQAFIID